MKKEDKFFYEDLVEKLKENKFLNDQNFEVKQEYNNIIIKKTSAKVDEKFILEQIEARIQARKSGNFKLADKIRDDLLENGIDVEDNQDKTQWKYKWIKKKFLFLTLH